jgi:hypothetical protein
MMPSAGATRLARKLAALPDPIMRESVLTEHLNGADPRESVILLDEFLSLGRRGTPPFNIALLTLAETLSQQLLSYEQQAQLYAAAKEAGLVLLVQLFLSSQRSPEHAPADEKDRELTLGHRKWQARSTRREVLEKLLRDPEPEVLPILLQNERIVERDVVQLAARRPTLPQLQWLLFSSRRWLMRYAVKRSLVLNPYTPTDLSIRLLGFLNACDLRLVVNSPTLPDPVREAARCLAQRSGERTE